MANGRWNQGAQLIVDEALRVHEEELRTLPVESEDDLAYIEDMIARGLRSRRNILQLRHSDGRRTRPWCELGRRRTTPSSRPSL